MIKLFILTLALIVTHVQAQLDQHLLKERILEDCKEMGEFFLNSDWNGFSQFIYPYSIEQFGGLEKFISTLEAGTKNMKNEGAYVLDITFGQPTDIIQSKGTYQSLIPQHLKIKIEGGILKSTSYLVAISKNSHQWYFLDVSKKTVEQIKQYLPPYSPQLIAPEWQPPTFIPD